MDNSTKIKVQINSETDLDKLLERHPEITVNLSEKVTSAFVTKLRSEFAKIIKEQLADLKWLLPREGGASQTNAGVYITQNSDAPGGWEVKLTTQLQYALRQEISRLVKNCIDDKLSAMTHDDIITEYRAGVDKVVEKALALTNVEHIRMEAERKINEKLVESLSQSLVTTLLKK